MNHYDVLGVKRDSTDEEIKKAYKLLALKNHPDRNPGNSVAESAFRDVTTAYSILSDPEKKASYDARLNFEDLRSQAKRPNFPDNFFGDFFTPFSSRVKEAIRDVPGHDVNAEVRISFAESMSGTKREVQTGNIISCSTCSGTGAKPGTRVVTCGACGGSGVVPNAFAGAERACPACRGSKTTAVSRCHNCKGTGRSSERETIVIHIPAGIGDGQVMKVRGRGSSGSPPGDLYVTVYINEDPQIRRSGLNLHISYQVPLKVMIDGGVISVNSPTGSSHQIEVGPCNKSGTEILVPGGGLPSPTGRSKGDLYVRLDAEVPGRLTARGKKLLDELMCELTYELKHQNHVSSFRPSSNDSVHGFILTRFFTAIRPASKEFNFPV